VYYLIAFWLFVCTAAVYAYTHTPLGRIINAVRDNPERVEFIGYDPQHARYLTLILSGFFAGISGGLAAINFEIVSAENLGAIRSGTILLFTIIGGTAWFIGPMLGAVAGVFLTVVLSTHTSAWQMYLGLFFVVTVMYAPGGIAGMVHLLIRTVQRERSGRLWLLLALAIFFAVLIMFGAVMMIEMLYRLALESGYGSTMNLFGVSIDVAANLAWLCAGGLFALGLTGLIHVKSRLMQVWIALDEVSEAEAQKETS
jgi:branched-chain amino acid transport system permease protein